MPTMPGLNLGMIGMEVCPFEVMTRVLLDALRSQGWSDDVDAVEDGDGASPSAPISTTVHFKDLYIPSSPGMPSETDEQLIAFAKNTYKECAIVDATRRRHGATRRADGRRFADTRWAVGAVYAFGAVHLARMEVPSAPVSVMFPPTDIPVVRTVLSDADALRLLRGSTQTGSAARSA